MKIALYINTKLTEYTPHGKRIDRNPNNLEIFRFALETYSHIKFSGVYIYCEIGQEFNDKGDQLLDYAKSLFPNNSWICNKRNFTINQHLTAVRLIESNCDAVLYLGNHDHIYVARPDFNFIEYVSKIFSSTVADTVYISHFPEIIARFGLYPFINQPSSSLSVASDVKLLKWKNFDSVQVFRRGILRRFWENQPTSLEEDFGGFIRSDDPRFPLRISSFEVITHVPTLELFRHFDGYQHAGIYGYELDADFLDRYSYGNQGNEFLMKYKLYSNSMRIENDIKCYTDDNPRFVSVSNISVLKILKAIRILICVDIISFVRLRLKSFL